MLIKEAVEKRIVELCNQKGIAINALANISGVSPSTVYSILNEKSQNPGVCSIKKNFIMEDTIAIILNLT